MDRTKLRLAAILALRNSIGILLTAIVLLPALSILNRIFDRTWNVDWRSILAVSSILTGCVFSFFFITQLLEFWAAEKRQASNRFVFPGAMWIRGICLLCIVLGVVLAVGTYREGDPWWDVVSSFAFVLLGYFTWPRVIVLSDHEIRKRGPLLRWNRIAYGDIASMTFDRSCKEIVVFGNNTDRITHTKMHIDAAKFIEDLESATGREIAVLGSSK